MIRRRYKSSIKRAHHPYVRGNARRRQTCAAFDDGSRGDGRPPQNLTARRPDRNAILSLDHTQLDIHVQGRGTGRHLHYRPWLTVIVDRYTRLVMRFAVTPNQPTPRKLRRLLAALYRRNRCSDQGAANPPALISADSGPSYKSRVASELTNRVGIELHRTPPSTIGHKVISERLFSALGRDLLNKLPGHASEEHPATVPKADSLLTLTELRTLIDEWVAKHNRREE